MIQAYIRTAASRGREVERVGPFTATFTPGADSQFINYAIPDEVAEPTPAEVAALIQAYERRGLLPRLEYLPGLAPAVEPALVAAGFAVEERLPLMDCPAVIEQPVPEGYELFTPESEDDFGAMVGAQHEAFGDEPPGEGEIARARSTVAAGGLACYAREVASGEPAGGGLCTALRDGMTEVVGVAVRKRHERRGLGGAITLALTRAAFAAGAHTIFLTPAGDAQERVYARVGYRRIDSMLFMFRPSPDRRPE